MRCNPNCSSLKDKVSIRPSVSRRKVHQQWNTRQYLDNKKIKIISSLHLLDLINEQVLAFSRLNRIEQACAQWGVSVKKHLKASFTPTSLLHFKRLSILLELKSCFCRNKIQQQELKMPLETELL